jgi:hypothetical protein
MSRRLDQLSSQLRPLAVEVIARLAERGIAIMIVDTDRTVEEHRANLAKGTSSASLSFHLPRYMRTLTGAEGVDPDRDKSDAIDLVPYDQYQLHGPDKLQWNTSDPVWAVIGEVGESLGLEWGGRWKKPHDPGHLQLPRRIWFKGAPQ